MRKTYWQKIADAKAKGISTEQFERIENLESAIAHYEEEIKKCEAEIKSIEEEVSSIESGE
jgi:flagellar biosynthesis chaperone FliJ